MGDASRGFVGGFFGCFGVLAAILVVIVALAVYGGARSSSARGEAVRLGTVAEGDLLPVCAAATLAAQRQFVGADGLDVVIGDKPFVSEPGAQPVVTCPVKVGRKYGAMNVRVICDDYLDSKCAMVNKVALDGRDLAGR